MAENEAAVEEVELDDARVEAIRAAVGFGDRDRVLALVEPLHAADIADFLEQIEPEERRGFLLLYSGEIDGDLLSEIDETIREEVIESLPAEVVAEAVRDLDTDDVVDILEDLEASAQGRILDALDMADRVAVEQAMAFPEGSAGRLMQREVVVAPEHWTVGEAIDHLRGAEALPDQFYHVILIDPRMKPQGYVTLGRILSARRDAALRDLAEDSFRTVEATEEESEVAYMFNQYHLISCPVVDAGGRLVGVITIDDAMNVLDEEHEEDMLRLAGVGEEASVLDGPWATVRQRLPWLVVNLFTASISAFVISRFEATITAIVALAALMPIVASTGGIAGTQSLAVAVRALATRDLTSANARRVVMRELAAGAINGAALAAIIGVAGGLIFADPWIGGVLAMAMVVNQIVAALGGVMVPLTLERMGLDPALASGTFVTTLTDVMGFLAFLGLATLVLL
ncbi:magnesium transporter [Rhodobacteraceae bacterium HSP-20]|uniref:Magnesium transporter MgtE n=1 Tax=Paragemmobacter amnigenus TaxID=2852097 RepID=A0ABS6J6P3_9RHOB|nr:magnesium transporter [Rhodobacter amnigenus]MBU9699227.1 magnesium transporter [Rhodobacter amnigenus]MBV4390454.1 magnesium transporter [Rhodobacter amnigenus]